MENRLKLRISRMFSFGSCRPRSISDAVEKAVFSPQDPQAAHLLRPTAEQRPLPSLCRPACPDPTKSINPTCIISARKDAVSRRRVLPSSSEHHRHYYSPLCPASSSFYRAPPKQSKANKKKKEKKDKKKGKKCHQSRPLIITTSSQDTNTTHDWFSSDDEREEDDRDRGYETETLFSSVSLSSDDSSAARRRHRRNRRRRKASHSRRRATVADPPEEDLGSNIKGSFAVVKRSSDPHGDFRASMVEMIVERQLFGAEELERLLRCFLALNSGRHHAVIVEVFTEIWETLFSSSRSPVHWS